MACVDRSLTSLLLSSCAWPSVTVCCCYDCNIARGAWPSVIVCCCYGCHIARGAWPSVTIYCCYGCNIARGHSLVWELVSSTIIVNDIHKCLG